MKDFRAHAGLNWAAAQGHTMGKHTPLSERTSKPYAMALGGLVGFGGFLQKQ